MSDQQLVRFEPGKMALFTRDLGEMKSMIAETLGPAGLNEFDLPRIKIPPQGMTQWVTQTLEGEQAVPHLDCVVVLAKDARVYWRGSMEEGGGSPPDCRSDDAIVGRGDPGGDCRTCPLAQFGSADDGEGAGQACKAIKLLFILRGEQILPEVVVLPPTSGKPAKQWLISLLSAGARHTDVVTRIGLEKAQNKAGIKYSRATFKTLGKLTPEQAGRARAMQQALLPMVKRVVVDVTADLKQ